MVTWDEVFGLKKKGEVRITTPSLGEEVVKACRMALLGLSFPPTTILSPDGLQCHCKRSGEWNQGCRVCWAIQIEKKRRSVVSKSGNWKSMIESFLNEFFLSSVLPKIGPICSLIELRVLGREIERILNAIHVLLTGKNRWECLISTMEVEKIVHTSNPSFSHLLEELFEFEVSRSLEGEGPVELLRMFDDPQQRMLRYKRVIAERHPELFLRNITTIGCGTEICSAIGVDVKPSEGEEGVYESARTASVTPRIDFAEVEPFIPQPLDVRELPPIYRLDSIRTRLDEEAENLGRLTRDPDFGSDLLKKLRVVLLHTSDLISSVCFEALDPFFSLESEDSACELVARCLETTEEVQVEVGSCNSASMNVFALLEGLSFHIPFPVIYRNAFRLLAAVEYALHCHSRSWKPVMSWRANSAIYTVWWTLKSHLTSLHQFLRISAVEGNMQTMIHDLEQANTFEDQLQAHAQFVERIERDLFLKPAGKPFLDAAVELARLAVSFRSVIQRCFAFQRDEEDVLFELEPLVADLNKTVTFLRINLRTDFWSFIS